MNGSQLKGLDNMGAKIYDSHGYLCGLTVCQRTPKFWGVTLYIHVGYMLYKNQLIMSF